MRKRGTAREWIIRYTALCLMVPLPIIALLLISGKTLLWGMDAYYQQYTSFGYVTNRWCYGYALAVCLTGAWALS